LAQTSWIGLPNILTQQSVIPERIQKECTVHVLVQDVTEMHDGEKLLPAGHNQLKNLEQLKRKLETTGAASQKVAASILSYNPSRA
jgi:lipid A disaccharide synthetase